MADPDRVQAIKWESPSRGGTQTDESPTEINPNQDALDSKGLYIQDDTSADDTVLVGRDNSGNMTFKDGVVSGVKTLFELSAGGGLTPEAHRVLDQLVHEIDESCYVEYAYSANKISTIDIWTSSAKTLKIRDFAYTYTGNLISTETVQQYDGTGSVVETLTTTYAYSGGNIASETCVRS